MVVNFNMQLNYKLELARQNRNEGRRNLFQTQKTFFVFINKSVEIQELSTGGIKQNQNVRA